MQKNDVIALPPGSPWEWGDLSADQVMNLSALTDAGPNGPLFQYAATRRCLALRGAVEAGDGFQILDCVRQCGLHGLVMPDWLVSAFNRRFDAVLSGQAISWDDPLSFGRPYPKGTHKNAVVKRRRNRIAVWLAINKAVLAGRNVSEELFEEVAHSVGSNSTDIKKLYREAKDVLGLSDPVESKRRLDEQSHMLSSACVAVESEAGSIQASNGASLAIHEASTSRRKISKSNAVKKRRG